MKKILSFAALFLCCAISLSAKTAFTPTKQDAFKLNNKNRTYGYQLWDNDQKITFVFDFAKYQELRIKQIKKVYVTGTFNEWKATVSDWELTETRNDVWTLDKDASQIQVPGNLGFPEFRFFLIADVEYTVDICGKYIDRIEERKFTLEPLNILTAVQGNGNSMILFTEDEFNTFRENKNKAKTIAKAKNFNLENQTDEETISNFRLVPGTTKLFRGYHPYKLAHPKLNTEAPRIQTVNKLLKQNGIQSIITLTGNEQLILGKEQLSVYVQDIRENKNQLFLNQLSEYYTSRITEEGFANAIKEIVTFVNSHPGPYYMHCHTGTHQTGIMAALFAGLSGADWTQITADYQKSNDMETGDFYDYRYLEYYLTRFLGKDPAESENLQKEIESVLISRQILSQEEINQFVKNIK